MTQKPPPNLPTTWKDPDLEHVTSSTYKKVYEPSEDTFLMMEAFEKQAPYFYTALPDHIECLEIGTGTGILSAYLHRILTSLPKRSHQDSQASPAASSEIETDAGILAYPTKSARMTAVDINPDAVRVAQETFQRNQVQGQVVLSDLATNVLDELKNQVHILFFNHPYVPCPRDELEAADMHARSYAGGMKGREVLDRFIPQIPQLLSNHPAAAFYVVVLHPANDVLELNTLLAEQCGLVQAGIVTARKEGIECLAIVRYTRQQRDQSSDAPSVDSKYDSDLGPPLVSATPDAILETSRKNMGTHQPSSIPQAPPTSVDKPEADECKAELQRPKQTREAATEDSDSDDDSVRQFWK